MLMLSKKLKLNSTLMLLSALLAYACTDKKIEQDEKQKDAAESTPEDQSSADSIQAAATRFDEMMQYYSQRYEIPSEYRNEGALRSGKLWSYLSQLNEQEIQDYYAKNKVGYDAFTKNPVALNGTPAVIFRLLPEVMPAVFSDAKFEESTGYFKLAKTDFLPWGFAYTQAPAAANGQPSPLLVNLTCAACHTGRVVDPTGQTKMLVGAPSTVADINGFRSILMQAVKDPAFTVENFSAILSAKKDGELYGPDRIAQERIDKAIFLGTAQSPALGAALLKAFKDGLLQKADYAAKTAGAFSYKNDLRLMAHSPGHIDFPVAVSLALAPVPEVLADPAAALKRYFPSAPGIGDIMSVWQQDKRVFAQWDGNLKNKLTRNLGAELGIAGDPRAVNFPNGPLTTVFVDKLPAPAYPFRVDMIKAGEGRAVYEKACASCHESEKFMPVAAIGTEPGRATGLTKDTRLLLVTALKAACMDKSLADCQIPDDEIVVPREDNPGYISLPMDGIWARAPYLHNGSVPTLYHLLVADERPISFKLNDFSYDENKLGYNWEIKAQADYPNQDNPNQSNGKETPKAPLLVRYDTKIPGYGNGGHADIKIFNGGIDFKKDRQKLDALLEYLKTR